MFYCSIQSGAWSQEKLTFNWNPSEDRIRMRDPTHSTKRCHSHQKRRRANHAGTCRYQSEAVSQGFAKPSVRTTTDGASRNSRSIGRSFADNQSCPASMSFPEEAVRGPGRAIAPLARIRAVTHGLKSRTLLLYTSVTLSYSLVQSEFTSKVKLILVMRS